VVPRGKEVISSIGESPPDTSAITGDVLLSATPTGVDNSTEPAFPPIGDQKGLGSCTTFATTYYHLTYTVGEAQGWADKPGEDKIFSPRWTYNMVNNGENRGSSFLDNYGLLEKHGAATWFEFPYDGIDYRSWVTNRPQVWEGAIAYRTNPVEYTENLTADELIDLLRQLLADGEIVTFGTHISNWQYKVIGDNPLTNEDDYASFIGKPAAYWVNGTQGGHAMTIVGYNDIIWVDINGDGNCDDDPLGEKMAEQGAFRIANSWGENWDPMRDGVTDGGFTWLAYDALRPTSSVGPNDPRYPAIHHNRVFRIAVKDPNYTPKMVAEFTVNHGKRNQLCMSLGISDTSTEDPSETWLPGAINFQGGSYAFDGTTKACDGMFVFDFTDLGTGTRIYYLGMEDNTKKRHAIATLYSFQIRDVYGGSAQATYDPPITVEAGQVYVYLDYTFTPPDTTPPGKVTNLTVTPASCAQLDLDWNANTEPDLDHYNVYRGTATGGPYDLIASSTTNSYSDTGLTASRTYYYVVSAADTSGNEGGTSGEASGTTSADDLGPVTSNVTADPNPTNGANSVTLTADVSDSPTGNSNIVAAEYFVDTIGPDGSGTPMSASDGTFDSPTEGVTTSIDVFDWAVGQYTLYVHGKDATDNNWGATASVVLEVTTEPTEPTTVSVSSITYDTMGGKNQNRHLLITVAVVDNLGNSVANASVSVDILLEGALYDSVTDTTEPNGIVTFKVANAPSGYYTTIVTDVTAEGLTWDGITPENGFPKGQTALLQNIPNPFNPDTWIPFALDRDCEVTIKIYNVTGKLVRTLDLGYLNAGVYVDKGTAAYWDGKNANGERVSSGVYVYLMEAGSFRAMKKMVIMK